MQVIGEPNTFHAPFKTEKPCRVQQKPSRCFHVDTCTASFHSNKSNITFIKSKILWTRKHTGSCTRDRTLQTTTDDNGREIGNFALFGDLLARMTLTDGVASGFHRPLMLSAGQAQYSEELLSSQWDMGLIDTRRSRVASVMTFPCLIGWKTADSGITSNPFIHKQREE